MGRYSIVPSSCINGFVDVPTGARPVEFPSLDVGGDAGDARGGGVSGVEHGVVDVGIIGDGTERGDVGGGSFAEDEGVGWGCEGERGVEGGRRHCRCGGDRG